MLVSILHCAGLVACTAVGPDYRAEDPKVPSAWPERAAQQAEPTVPPSVPDMQSDPDPHWWRSFHDATLDTLIERAVAGNLDLKAAMLRIVSARAEERVARAQGLPSLKASGTYTREQLGARGLIDEQGSSFGSIGSSSTAESLIKQIEEPVSLFQAGFDASWELDLFGRVRRATEAAQAQTQSAIESRNDALVSLEAEIAQTYLQLRGAQALRALAQEQIQVAGQIVELSESRNRFGLASQTDVESARATLSTSAALLPQYDSQIAQAENALAVLTGEAPGAVDALVEAPAALPPVPAIVPIGLPASLARRRPDIREAEANLHAATAQIGVAVAQLFPEISLTVQGGRRATEARYLSHWANNFWSVVPGISLPIFQGGALEANVTSAKADASISLLSYRKVVLGALQDVDNALTAYASDQNRRDALGAAVEANRRTLELAQSGYGHGIVSFITVLNAEQQLDQNQQQLAQLSAQAEIDLVALYKALGGGWQQDEKAEDAGAASRPASLAAASRSSEH